MSQSKILIVVAVIGLGVIVYFATMPKQTADEALKNAPSVATESTNDEAIPEATAQQGKKMAFSEFMKNGGSYKCTVQQNTQGIDTEGIVYIDGELLRGEYTTATQGMQIESTLIVRDGYTHSWSSMMPTMGFKAKVVAEAQANTQTGTSGNIAFNAEQIGDYSCAAWNADASFFVLPSEVVFTEVN